MARNSTARTQDAADALLAWLDQRSGVAPSSDQRLIGEPVERSAENERRGAATLGGATWPAAAHPAKDDRPPAIVPAHTDWLFHHLLVEGPVDALGAFRQQAAGAGVIPWHLDLDRLEEDFFLKLAAPTGQPRTLSLDGARLLACELRNAVARRHALAVARVGRSQACAVDLHTLVPVPNDLLRQGPDNPDALRWLWTHWGTTAALRHVALVPAPKGGKPDATAFRVSFWSADWTPWRALATVQSRYPALRFELQPCYALA